MLYERRQSLLLSQSGFKQLLSEILTDKFHQYLLQMDQEFQFYSFSANKRLWKVFSTKSWSLLLSQSGLKQRESLPLEFYQYLEQFAQPFYFSLLLADRVDYQQGALQKKQVTDPFTEPFKIDESMELQYELHNSFYSSMMKGTVISSFRTAPCTKPSTSKTFTAI